MRRQRSTRWLDSLIGQGLTLGLFSGLLVFIAVYLGWMTGVERGAMDAMYRARGKLYPSKNIVIVHADEGTVARFGRWPLPRKVYADIINRLSAAGAKTIAFDVQFPAPSDRPKDDLALIEACSAARSVVQAAVFYVPGASTTSTFDTASRSLALRGGRFQLDDKISDHELFGLDAVSSTVAIGPLLDSAAAVGHVTVYPEWDGALRRIPHYIRYKEKTYPSLSLAAAAHFLSVMPQDIRVDDKAVFIAERRIPLNQKGESLINWRGSTGVFPLYTFQQVLATSAAEKLPDEIFKNSIVLIGITHPGAYERYATPLSPNQPAVELQANAIDNILENRAIQESPPWMPVALIFAMSLLAGVLTSGRGARQGALIMLGLSAVLWISGSLLLAQALWYLPVAAPILAAVLSCGLTLSYRQLHDARDLKIAEERYALAVRGANDGIWDWNLETGEIYFSPRWRSMLGGDETTIPSSVEAWTERVHPDDLERVAHEFKRHLTGKTAHYECEYRIRNNSAEYLWVLARGLRVPETGKPERVAGSMTDISARKQAEGELLHNAFYDALTGLPNRALFMDRLGRAIGRAERHSGYMFAVLFLDIDRFKIINDSLGHTLGDQLLVSVAQRLETCLRPGDTAARLGGDEFTLLLDGINGLEDAIRVAERFQMEIARPFNLDGHEIVSGASVGIVASGEKGQFTHYGQPEDILRDADTALYRAKAQGRGRHEVFDETMHQHAVSMLRLEADLRQALENDAFLIFFQPIIALNSGQIAGFEALARWQHPERGLISPGEFITLAEETGLIIPIDQWMLRQACRQTLLWHQTLAREKPQHPKPTVSVNLSSRHFSTPGLLRHIAQVLQETGFPPEYLRLEITESVILENIDSAVAMLGELKALGLQLAIDDFGTGYSSLSYLHRLPIDILKIDRSFVMRMGTDGENSEIVRAVITLARSLHMIVNAEGVETPAQLAQLKALECDYCQGYYFSPPLGTSAATEYLMHGHAAAELQRKSQVFKAIG